MSSSKMASSSSTKPVNFELAKTTDRANFQKKSQQQEKDDWEKFKAWQNLNKQDEIVQHLETIALKMGTHEIRSGAHKPDPKQSSRAIQAMISGGQGYITEAQVQALVHFVRVHPERKPEDFNYGSLFELKDEFRAYYEALICFFKYTEDPKLSWPDIEPDPVHEQIGALGVYHPAVQKHLQAYLPAGDPMHEKIPDIKNIEGLNSMYELMEAIDHKGQIHSKETND
jgi:hypothetical protein